MIHGQSSERIESEAQPLNESRQETQSRDCLYIASHWIQTIMKDLKIARRRARTVFCASTTRPGAEATHSSAITPSRSEVHRM